MASLSSQQTNNGGSSSTEQGFVVINPGQHLSIFKLTESNYLTWKLQVLNTIYGYSLEQFILSDEKPDKKIQRTSEIEERGSEGDLTDNLKFVTWMRQDRLLCSWLIGSMNEDLVPQIVGCETSREIWVSLEQTFSTSNTAKIMQLKRDLQNAKKWASTVKEFVSKIKNLEVEKIVVSSHLEMRSPIPELSQVQIIKEPIDSLTPRELFTKEHKQLLKYGEEWMKSTANSCMLVATLIATVVFAAAFTVPGGNDDKEGIPIFRQNQAFTVFVISDVVALVLSTTSILTFLSILTSRYAEDDFLMSLPSKLLFGLVTLFLSIACMVVSFSAAFFIAYDKTKAKIPLGIAAVAILPVGCFVCSTLNLWLTYCAQLIGLNFL